MIIKTIIISIILIFLLQQIYNFIYEHLLEEPPNIKFTAIEKYKKIAEEAIASVKNVKIEENTTHLSQLQPTIETVYDATTVTSTDDMENYLLNLVINDAAAV